MAYYLEFFCNELKNKLSEAEITAYELLFTTTEYGEEELAKLGLWMQLITSLRNEFFRCVNLSILTGEYVEFTGYKSKWDEIYNNLETIKKLIPDPDPESIVQEDHANSIFHKNFYQPLKIILNGNEVFELEELLNSSKDYSYNLIFQIRPRELSIDLGNVSENFRNQILFTQHQIILCIIDHQLRMSWLEICIELIEEWKTDKFSSLYNEDYFKLTNEKCNFLVKKLILRYNQDYETVKAYKVGPKRIVLNDSSHMLNDSLEEQFKRARNHYTEGEKNVYNPELLTEVKRKIQQRKELTLSEYHLAVKQFKDREKSLQLVKMTKEHFEGKYLEINLDSKNDFDKYSFDVARLYINNNYFSALIEFDSTNSDEIKVQFLELLKLHQLLGIKNFFPFQKMAIYHLGKVETLISLLNRNRHITDSEIQEVEKLVFNLDEYIKNWSFSLDWCGKNQFLPFMLTFDECKYLCEYNSNKYDLFIASSFVIPFDFKVRKSEFDDAQERLRTVKLQLKFIMEFSKNQIVTEMSRFEEILNNHELKLKDQEGRSIEILGIFSAIVLFASTSIQIFDKVKTLSDGLLFISCFALCLILFSLTIFRITDKEKFQNKFWLIFIFLGALTIWNILSLDSNSKEKSSKDESKPKALIDSISVNKPSKCDVFRKATTDSVQKGRIQN